MTKYTTFVSVINNKKIHMILSTIKNFEHLAGDFPAEMFGCVCIFMKL